jgi:hypothetical protein
VYIALSLLYSQVPMCDQDADREKELLPPSFPLAKHVQNTFYGTLDSTVVCLLLFLRRENDQQAALGIHDERHGRRSNSAWSWARLSFLGGSHWCPLAGISAVYNKFCGRGAEGGSGGHHINSTKTLKKHPIPPILPLLPILPMTT